MSIVNGKKQLPAGTRSVSRREFLKVSGAGAVIAAMPILPGVAWAQPEGGRIRLDTRPARIKSHKVDASSSSGTARNATDGDLSTFWQASSDGTQWLEVDFGDRFSLQKIQQTFAENRVWSFVIKGSLDGRNWSTLIDRSKGRAGHTFAESVNGIFRYVRLEILSSDSGHPASSVDFKAIGTRPIANLASEGSATASSHKSEYGPERALDGNISSYWIAEDDGLPQWISVDLGESLEVLAVEQNFKDFDTWRFKIESSRDGSEWKMLADESEGMEGQSFHIQSEGRFRYIRLTILGSESDFWANSVDLKVIGPARPRNVRERDLAPGTSVQSSSLKPKHEPFNVVDEDPSTWWEAYDTELPQSLVVDLGNESYISQVEHTFAQEGDWSFKLEGSLDKSDWKTLGKSRGERESGHSFRQRVRGNYRYVKLTITGSPGKEIPAAVEQIKILGMGSPVRTRWWENRSGVARFFPVWQRITLNEITDQLDELKAQGHSAIELAPIFEGVRDVWAGLGVTNLYNVHPDVGTFEDLDTLLSEAHDRDMKILFFANPGYAHEDAPFFQKALKDFSNGVESEERSWFDIRSEPGPYDRWIYNEEYDAYYWALWDDRAPSFHFAKQTWRDEVRKYLKFWMDKGFDGIILDAPNVYHQTTLEYNNYAITDVLRNYDTFMNGEGVRERGYITDWHYNALQDYTLTQWAVPPDPGSSTVIDAIDSGNPDNLESILKGYRDEMTEAGGITQIAPNWGRRDYPVEKRLMEITTLITIGTLFYVHNDYFTINPTELDFPDWTEEQLNRMYALLKVQSSYEGLSPSGLRVKLPTNEDTKFYAFLRTNKDGKVKALVILNFQGSEKNVTVDLSNIGVREQVPVDLLREEAAPAITSSSYTVTVPPLNATILAVD